MYEVSRVVEFVETENKKVGCQGVGGMGSYGPSCRKGVLLREDEESLELSGGDDCTEM